MEIKRSGNFANLKNLIINIYTIRESWPEKISINEGFLFTPKKPSFIEIWLI